MYNLRAAEEEMRRKRWGGGEGADKTPEVFWQNIQVALLRSRKFSREDTQCLLSQKCRIHSARLKCNRPNSSEYARKTIENCPSPVSQGLMGTTTLVPKYTLVLQITLEWGGTQCAIETRQGRPATIHQTVILLCKTEHQL